MTDLNSLTSDKQLSLYAANDIDSRGEITGVGIDSNTGEARAFIAVLGPSSGSSANKGADAARVTISDAVRSRILPKLGLGGIGAAPIKQK